MEGEGLGAALLDGAVERAAGEGFELAMLDTFATRPWLPGFYARHGFVERCVERFADGTEWRQFRKRLR